VKIKKPVGWHLFK